MAAPKTKLPFVLIYTGLLVFAFAFTAWKALDEEAHNSSIMRSSSTFERVCTLDFPDQIAGCLGRLIFPAGQDLGNRQLLNPGLQSRTAVAPFNPITLTNAYFPAAGDILRTAADLSPPANNYITPPGFNVQWDFSTLSADQTMVTHFQPATNGSAFANYPGADLVTINGAGIETYYNVTAAEFSLIGQSGYSLVGGLPVYMHLNYNPSVLERRSPTNFFDVFQSSSGIQEGWAISEFPPGFINCFPFIADSLRLRVAINRLNAADAWGSLTIPGGTYDVLRIKSTTYTETRLDARIAPLGWLDVTDLAIQYCGLPGFGVDTMVTHNFFNNTVKEPIAIVFLDASQSFAQKVEFKDPGSCLRVTSTLNTGPGSLREAIACSMAGDTIRFEPDVHQQTIYMDLPTIPIQHPLTLFADPLHNVTISNFNAANTGIIFSLQDRLSVSGLKISGQTAESMILKVESNGYLELSPTEVHRMTLNKN